MRLENQNHDLAGGVTVGISDNSFSLALSMGRGCGSLCMKHVNEASEVWFVFTYFYLYKKSGGAIALPDLCLAPPMNEHKGIHTARLNHSLPLCAVLRCQSNINQTVPSSSWRHLLTNPKARRQRPWLPLQWLLYQLSSHLLSEGRQTCLLFQLLQGQARRCTRETQACVPLGTPSTSGGGGSLLQVRVCPTMAAVQVHTCRSYLATCTWIISNVINRIKESAKRSLIAVGCAEQIQAGRTPYQFCLMVIFYVDLNFIPPLAFYACSIV